MGYSVYLIYILFAKSDALKRAANEKQILLDECLNNKKRLLETKEKLNELTKNVCVIHTFGCC